MTAFPLDSALYKARLGWQPPPGTHVCVVCTSLTGPIWCTTPGAELPAKFQ